MTRSSAHDSEPAAPSAGATRERRTQAERRAETRAKLLDATVACLAEYGYAGASTNVIVRRAGVSRGALLHHFPAKQALLAAAADHVFDLRLREFRTAMDEIPGDAGPVVRAEGALDLLWGIFQGPAFDAWLELLVAARTDPELHVEMTEVQRRLEARVDDTFRLLFPRPTDLPLPSGIPDLYAQVPGLVFSCYEGIALGRITDTPGYDPDASVRALKTIVVMLAQLAVQAGLVPAD